MLGSGPSYVTRRPQISGSGVGNNFGVIGASWPPFFLFLPLGYVFHGDSCASYVLHNGASPWTWQVHEKGGLFPSGSGRDEAERRELCSCFDPFTIDGALIFLSDRSLISHEVPRVHEISQGTRIPFHGQSLLPNAAVSSSFKRLTGTKLSRG